MEVTDFDGDVACRVGEDRESGGENEEDEAEDANDDSRDVLGNNNHGDNDN